MTNREFYNAIVNGNYADELTEYARTALEHLDATNEKRRIANAAKAVEKEAERAPLRDAILEVMTAEPKTASMLIAEAGVEVKPQAIPALLRANIGNGQIVKEPVKSKGKGTQVGYRLA